MKRIIFIVEGGIGKVLMSTVPLRGIKKKYPEHQIIVVCGFPDVLALNPNVDRAFAFGQQQYFYDDFVANADVKVFRKEPYLETDYLQKKKHLTEVWCELLDVPFDNSKPDLFLSKSEIAAAKDFIAKGFTKPLFLLQTHGGPPNQRIYKRDIPIDLAEKIVSAVSCEYDVFHLRYNEQPQAKGTKSGLFKLREALSLISLAKNGLVIDSFAQHAFAAFGKKTNVIWGGTSPVCLGYETHNNISQEACKTPFCHRPNSYLFDTINGNPWECPYDDACLKYDADEVIEKMGIEHAH